MSYTPLEVDLEEGRLYAWCTCGLTQKGAFCDGSHRETLGKKSLKFQADSSKKVWLCTCKKTQNPPYCDGSHQKKIPSLS